MAAVEKCLLSAIRSSSCIDSSDAGFEKAKMRTEKNRTKIMADDLSLVIQSPRDWIRESLDVNVFEVKSVSVSGKILSRTKQLLITQHGHRYATG